MHQADAFVDAYRLVEEAPEEEIQDDDRRRGILAEAAEVANAEHTRYKEELGLKKTAE